MKNFNNYIIEKFKINKDTRINQSNNPHTEDVLSFLDSINDKYKNTIEINRLINTLNIYFNDNKDIVGLNIYLSEKDNDNLDLNKEFNFIANCYQKDNYFLNKLSWQFKYTFFYSKGFECLKNPGNLGICIKANKFFDNSIFFINKDANITV